MAANQDPHFRRRDYQVLLPLMQAMEKPLPSAVSITTVADRLLEMRDGKLTS
ncbi:hypothetical protein ACNKHS_13465 [Shigella flexneri]